MTGVLTGVRVLQLAGIGPVPFCGMHLADLGANVIVVDSPANVQAQSRSSEVMNRGKRSVTRLTLAKRTGCSVSVRIMRALQFSEFGPPSVLHVADVPAQPV